MNRILAFALVLAMVAAALLGVKWQQAKRDAETERRREERQPIRQAALAPRENTAVQEVRRLELEIQALRSQLASRPEGVDAAFRVELDMLRRENASLHQIISNQMQLLAQARSQPVVTERVEEVAPPEEEEADPGVGLGLVNMEEFRLMNWRQGTMPMSGAAVVEIIPGGTAMVAGLQPGDIITSVDGDVVDSDSMLLDRLSEMAPGQVTTLTVNRDRSEISVPLMIPLLPAEEP